MSWIPDPYTLHEIKCEKCNNPWFKVPERGQNSNHCYQVVTKRSEIGYNQDQFDSKYFCEWCIPLVERNYRDQSPLTSWIARSCYKNAFDMPSALPNTFCWIDIYGNSQTLTYKKKKEGWYMEGLLGHETRVNFYEIYQGNNCQTCQHPLNEPSENQCCQSSQALISKEKGKGNDNNRERERERANSTITDSNRFIRSCS